MAEPTLHQVLEPSDKLPESDKPIKFVITFASRNQLTQIAKGSDKSPDKLIQDVIKDQLGCCVPRGQPISVEILDS